MRSLCVLAAATAAVVAVGGCLNFEMRVLDLSEMVAKLDVPEHIGTIAVPELADETASPGVAAEAYVCLMALADEVNRSVAQLAPELGDADRFPRLVPAGEVPAGETPGGQDGGEALVGGAPVGGAPADATLSVRLFDYEAGTGPAGEFRFRLTAQVSLVDNHERRELWAESFEADSGSLAQGAGAKEVRQAAFDDLAQAIMMRLLATWFVVDETRRVEVKAPTAEHLYEVGRFYEKRRAYGAALLYYDDLIRTFPRSPEAEAARARIGHVRKRLGADEGSPARE